MSFLAKQAGVQGKSAGATQGLVISASTGQQAG
jgi:hypothetical protein